MVSRDPETSEYLSGFTRKFEVKTPNITIQVNPDRTDLIETKIIDGRRCIVIQMDDSVEVNGIHIMGLTKE